jgi:4a-hydroxytetrahydrobiopterin dehydratase
MTDAMTPREFHEAEGVQDWRIVGDGACAYFRTDSYTTAARLVHAIAQLDGVEEQLPDIDVRPDGVTVRLVTFIEGYGGMTRGNAEMARRISELARDEGVASDPTMVQSVLVIPGSPDPSAVTPFWRAVLGYVPRADSPDADLVDPHGRGPGFWFEAMDEPRADGNGTIHIAVWVPEDQAEARIEAALAAGGRVVRDSDAPASVTLADAAGNEADVARITGRD